METDLGPFLRDLRQGKGFSLQRLAAAAGVSKSTLIRWESGEHRPRLAELEAVLQALLASEESREWAYLLLDAPRALARIREKDGPSGSEAASLLPTGGELLRIMRLRRGLYLEGVAERLGVTPSTVSRWESGKTALPTDLQEPLLNLLGARPEEIAAIHNGGLFLHPATTSPCSLEDLEQQMGALAESIRQGNHVVMDLEVLSFRAHLWPLARRDDHAWQIFIHSYTDYALWLSWVDRRREAGEQAQKALELIGNNPSLQEERLHAVLVSALMLAKNRGRKGAEQAVELLQGALPSAASPIHITGLYRDLADYASRSGQTEAALQYIHVAHEAAQRSENIQAQRCARYVHAQILLHAGQARAALPLLQESHLQPLQRTMESLQWVEALLAVDEKIEAHRWLEKTILMLNRYDYPQLRAQADDFARQL